jgi:hemoglobin
MLLLLGVRTRGRRFDSDLVHHRNFCKPSSISFSAKDLPPTVHPRFPNGMIRVILNARVASAVAVAWIAEAKMVPDNQPVSDRPALYDRLGGVYNIATVVDDLIDRIMVDPRLNANPRVDEAHHRVSAAGFKYFVTEMLCEAAGGPQHYSGRPMGDSHRHLMITDEEWLAFRDDLQQTLDKFAVPQPEQNEIKAIVESTREAIVVEPLQERPPSEAPTTS